MTEKLYELEPETLVFEARVLSCEPEGEHWAVVLDRTAFFPEGGGQGADHGTLDGAHVLDAHTSAGIITHQTDAPLTPGSCVTGRVDARRRLDMSQQHTGEHIFSGITHRLYGYSNVGFHIGTDAVTMDFNGPMEPEDVRRVELLANEAIWADLPVRAFVPSPEELARLSYRSKKALEGDVRLVSIEGVDLCACCGTHLPRTGAVGQLKVIGVMHYKGGVRISILCGRRALEYENRMLDSLHGAAQRLSCKPQEVDAQTGRLLTERDGLRYEKEQLAMRLFESAMKAQEQARVRVVCAEGLSAGQLGRAAGRLCAGADAALVLLPNGSGWNFALASETHDVRPAAQALLSRFGGRGGGPSSLAQGQLAGGAEADIRQVMAGLVPAEDHSPSASR